MSSFLDVIFLFILIGMNGYFCMAEIAVVAARRGKLQRLAEEGDKSAKRVLREQEEPTKTLSTIQVGITLVGILTGIVGGSALAEPMIGFLEWLGLGKGLASFLGLPIVVFLITYFSIVLGEIAPKRYAQNIPEEVACKMSWSLDAITFCLLPFVKLLTVSTDLLLRLLGHDQNPETGVTEDEIHAMIEEGRQTGVIEASEGDMVRNVFRLDDRQVGSVMIPRSDIEWIDLELSDEEKLRQVLSTGRTRLVAASGSLDDIRGILTKHQLLEQLAAGEKIDFTKNLIPAFYVPETLTCMELLEKFRSTSVPHALVVDEYGEVVGLVTPRDILEAIAGEFKPATTDDAWAVKRSDGSWLLDGIIPIPEMKDRLNIREVPRESEGRYNTLSGMVMLLLQRLPHTGDIVGWEGWKFEVVDMDGCRIDKVLAMPLPRKRKAA